MAQLNSLGFAEALDDAAIHLRLVAELRDVVRSRDPAPGHRGNPRWAAETLMLGLVVYLSAREVKPAKERSRRCPTLLEPDTADTVSDTYGLQTAARSFDTASALAHTLTDRLGPHQQREASRAVYDALGLLVAEDDCANDPRFGEALRHVGEQLTGLSRRVSGPIDRSIARDISGR